MHDIWNILTMKICLCEFFPPFQLTMNVPTSSFYRFCPNLFILSLPCFFLRDIEWYCIGRAFILLRHAMTKYIFRCLDEERYQQCPINLIAYNITTFLSIVAWHLIRDHHLVCINRKYISYLSLFMKVFSCNLFLTKFQQPLLLIHF